MSPRTQRGNAFVGLLVIVAVVWGLFALFGSGSTSDAQDKYNYDYKNKSGHTLDRDEAIDEHWDEIKDYLNGSETIEACSDESGNCYDLDAEISNGEVEQIYFSNGGYLYFGADIDSYGEASDYDQNGNGWDFTLDMNSSIVDDAVSDWASDNDYKIE